MLDKISRGIIEATYSDVGTETAFSSGPLSGAIQTNIPRKITFKEETIWVKRGDKVIHIPSMGTSAEDDFGTYFIEQPDIMIMLNDKLKVLEVFKNRTP